MRLRLQSWTCLPICLCYDPVCAIDTKSRSERDMLFMFELNKLSIVGSMSNRPRLGKAGPRARPLPILHKRDHRSPGILRISRVHDRHTPRDGRLTTWMFAASRQHAYHPDSKQLTSHTAPWRAAGYCHLSHDRLRPAAIPPRPRVDHDRMSSI